MIYGFYSLGMPPAKESAYMQGLFSNANRITIAIGFLLSPMILAEDICKTTLEATGKKPEWHYYGGVRYKGIPERLKSIQRGETSTRIELKPLYDPMLVSSRRDSGEARVLVNQLEDEGWQLGPRLSKSPDGDIFYSVPRRDPHRKIQVQTNHRSLTERNQEVLAEKLEELHEHVKKLDPSGQHELEHIVITQHPTEDLFVTENNNLIQLNLREVLNGRAPDRLNEILLERIMLSFDRTAPQNSIVRRDHELSAVVPATNSPSSIAEQYALRDLVIQAALEGNVAAKRSLLTEEMARLNLMITMNRRLGVFAEEIQNITSSASRSTVQEEAIRRLNERYEGLGLSRELRAF